MQGQYRHEALPYRGREEFIDCCAALADGARDRDERVLFLVAASKIADLRSRIGPADDCVGYLATDEHARNPALLTMLLDGFRITAGGRPCVGVNEPVVPGHSPAAAEEARFGESVLNCDRLADWAMHLLCLYDAESVDGDALAWMRRTHPTVRGQPANEDFEQGLAGEWFAMLLGPPPAGALTGEYGPTDLARVRRIVRDHAQRAGLREERREDFVLAVNEIVSNSLRHGGGTCRLALWTDRDTLLCDVRDEGRIEDPLVGRLAPTPEATAGRGLWLANQLCDVVQIRSSQAGTTVRLHLSR